MRPPRSSEGNRPASGVRSALAKQCIVCGKTFRPHSDETPSKFAARRACFRSCAAREGKVVLAAERVAGRGAEIDARDPHWRDQAACRNEDSELFFPIGDSGPAALQIAAAKSVCRHCPVEATCLEWALATRQEYGVWGGMSPAERGVLKRGGR